MTTKRAPSKIIPRAFPGITPEEVQDLIAHSRVNSYPTGTVLCREDEVENTFYMILEGDFEVTKDINKSEVRQLKTLGPGDFFGEMGIIHNAPRAATVTAKTDVVVLELDKQSFDQVLVRSASISLAMVHEISSRLRENDEMAIEDLRLRARELAQAYQQLAEQDVARREFLTNVAHELRTPLMAASGYLQFLQNGQVSEEQLPQAVDTINNNVNRIISLVNDILFLQEMELVLPEFEAVDMGEVASSVLERYKEQASARGVQLSLKEDHNLPPVSGDPKSLERALIALVDNAIKFSPNGGTVQVRLYEAGEVVYIRIDDPGMGIPSDVLPHIWDERPRREGAGTLRLYEVRRIVEAHGGQVWGASDPGHGSTFYVVLPKAVGTDDSPSRA